MEIRAFIAVELPEETKAELGRLSEKLKLTKNPACKTVGAGVMHLTLRFLGNVPVEKIEDIKSAILEAAKDTKAFRLKLKDVGCFPDVQRPRVIWVGLDGEVDNLLSFQKRLESALGKLGFPEEGRDFTPHLTLARVRDNCSPAERRRLGEAVRGLDYRPGLEFTVNHIALIRSVLKPQGPEYTTLAEINLG